MNHAFVVDASVAVKWLLEEEFSDRSQALLETSRRDRRPLYSPPHVANEVTNAIFQRLRRRSITEEEAEQAMEEFFSWPPVQLTSPPGLYQRAFAFAREHRLTNIYDSLYVVLAEMMDAELWTDDRTLINTIGSAVPRIRWIGDYPLP